MNLMKEREAIVEGIFYPENREELAETVKNFIGTSIESREVFGLIVPHAGYNYCGTHTGKAFGMVARNKVDTVLLLGPVHRDPEEGIFLSESDLFLTPLGSVKVDQELNEELLSVSTTIIRNDIPHLEEHCLEVQLPFIQTLFPDAKIVPILMGVPSPTAITALTRALDMILQDRLDHTFVVLSANASTFTEKSKAEESARVYRLYIENRDPDALIRGIRDGSINSCGAGCTASLLNLNCIHLRGTLVSEGNSHRTTRSEKHIVHYASFLLIAGEKNE